VLDVAEQGSLEDYSDHIETGDTQHRDEEDFGHCLLEATKGVAD
jgi:hypothetical protein